mmetsp:Transcript_2003/g.4519  ORF Transcript_2003/g.4519 Transcript_2003/m.4519 type:complete len:212 (-) Transcript_2003:328-963(-)
MPTRQSARGRATNWATRSPFAGRSLASLPWWPISALAARFSVALHCCQPWPRGCVAFYRGRCSRGPFPALAASGCQNDSARNGSWNATESAAAAGIRGAAAYCGSPRQTARTGEPSAFPETLCAAALPRPSAGHAPLPAPPGVAQAAHGPAYQGQRHHDRRSRLHDALRKRGEQSGCLADRLGQPPRLSPGPARTCLQWPRSPRLAASDAP